MKRSWKIAFDIPWYTNVYWRNGHIFVEIYTHFTFTVAFVLSFNWNMYLFLIFWVYFVLNILASQLQNASVNVLDSLFNALLSIYSKMCFLQCTVVVSEKHLASKSLLYEHTKRIGWLFLNKYSSRQKFWTNICLGMKRNVFVHCCNYMMCLLKITSYAAGIICLGMLIIGTRKTKNMFNHVVFFIDYAI